MNGSATRTFKQYDQYSAPAILTPQTDTRNSTYTFSQNAILLTFESTHLVQKERFKPFAGHFNDFNEVDQQILTVHVTPDHLLQRRTRSLEIPKTHSPSDIDVKSDRLSVQSDSKLRRSSQTRISLSQRGDNSAETAPAKISLVVDETIDEINVFPLKSLQDRAGFDSE